MNGVNNILKVYDQATAWEKLHGKEYFRRMHQRIAGIALAYETTVETAAGAFAALSPNNTEAGNYRDMARVLAAARDKHQFESFDVSSWGPNKLKAWMIARYSQPPLLVLGGMKVRSFYLNIIDPTDPRPVTVDGHMIGVWLGKRVNLRRRSSDDTTESAPSLSSGEYMNIVRDFRKAAKMYNLLPNQLQATVWHTWKRMHNNVWDPQLALWDTFLPVEMLNPLEVA